LRGELYYGAHARIRGLAKQKKKTAPERRRRESDLKGSEVAAPGCAREKKWEKRSLEREEIVRKKKNRFTSKQVSSDARR